MKKQKSHCRKSGRNPLARVPQALPVDECQTGTSPHRGTHPAIHLAGVQPHRGEQKMTHGYNLWGSRTNSLAKWLVFAVCLFSPVSGLRPQVFAQEATPAAKSACAELIASAWDARGKKDWESALKCSQACIDTYKEDADRQQAGLKLMPPQGEMEKVRALNDVATAYFIQAEVYRNHRFS